jgi:hypothetical protein
MLSKEETKELRRRHEELSELYRGKSVDAPLISHLWARVEYLETKEKIADE